MTASSSLESLEFLFQKKSSISKQISPHARLAVASAVNGEEAFQSQLAPDQKPKKRKILLDYNSCYRLWNPNEMALEIAKLKVEGFEVAFILNGKTDGEIFESLIEDKAEPGKKYDYKFKDKEGNDKSIFELSDQFIKENFSKLDHEASIEKLNLTRDASIILSYEQFDKVDKIFKQQYWANKERDGSNSALSYSLLKKPESDNNILTDHSIKSLVEFFNHKKFNKNNTEDTTKIITSLKNFHNYSTTLDFLSRLNEEKLVDLFDIFSADKTTKSISIQKSILKKLWFECSNFENVVKKAKTLDEFKDKEAHEIATSIHGNSPYFGKLISKPGSFDILERLSEESAFLIFTSDTNLDEISKYSVIAQQKINQTSFGEKIKVDFALLNNDAQDNFIEFSLQLSANKHKESLTLWSFIQIFSNPESNQQFNLTEQFGDAIINSLEGKKLLEFYNSFASNSASTFLEQLNDNQKTRFLDLLQNKINEADSSSIIDDKKLRVLITLQHFLDQPKILDFAKSILNSNSNTNTKLSIQIEDYYLNPAFQDLLLEMHEESEIDLNKFHLPQESKLFAKFRKNLLYLQALDKYDDPGTLEESKTSPLQISIFNFNDEALIRIKKKIDSGELDASKILSVNVFAFKKQDDKIKDSLITFCKLFPNLKCARIDIKDQNYHNLNYDNFLLENLPTLRIISEAQFSATRTGDTIFMGDARSSGASKKDSPTTFLMKETGKIIQRPTHNQVSLFIRTTSRKLNLNFVKLQDNLFVDNDESQAISSEESTSIENFSQQDFEAKKTALESSDSSEKTICSFSRNLQAITKNILPSISPDNKIIGYYTEPTSVDIQFFKDEKSGFYYAKTATECQIHYLIEGRELGLQTPTQSLENLPENVQKVITDYVGENPASFPLSVEHDEYKLPAFSTKKQFLDDLFNLENKGSCRHRVASVAHKFENNSLECGKDFRIIGVNGNHVLMEVKKQNNNEWVTLNLGGEESILEKAFEPNPPLVLPPKSNPLPTQLSMSETLSRTNSSAGSDGQSGGQNYGVARGNANQSLLAQCLSCLRFGAGVVVPNQEQSFLTDPSSTSELVFSSEQQRQKPEIKPEINTPAISLKELIKIEKRKLQNLKILGSALDKLHQIKKVEDLESFKTDFEQFVTKNKSSSLLLKTNRGEELKNYLLRMSSSSQNPPNPSDDQSTSTVTPNTTALTSSALSFQAFYASSPQDLTAKKSTLHIGKDDESLNTETKTVNINANTPLLSFLENAKQNNDKQHVLIIDWGNFDASSQVAFNTMFDKGSRKIDDQEIPDNVKIVCIDSSKQKTTDSSILSRFGEALNLSSIKKDQFAASPSETSSGVREITEIAFDGEGLVNWKEKLFGRIIVDGNKIKWEQSDFAKSLEAFAKDATAGSNPDQPEQKGLHINFKNFSLTQQQEMKIFFEQAKAKGSIDYHDYKITIPQDLSINFAQKEFEFTEVLKSFKPADSADSLTSTSPDSNQLRLNIYKNSLASNQLPTDIHLINSHLFDQLLTQPQIDGNQYQEKAGLIESASTSDSKTLKLFLSEDLTKQQFYCLLNQAKEHQVALEIYVAKDVEIPKVDLKKFTQEFGLDKGAELTRDSDQAGGVGFSAIRTSRESSPSPESSRIIITNNIEESLNKTITAIESANSQTPHAKTINLVNVEDILYGDLFGKTQHQLITKEDGSQHFAFEKIETAIKTKLEAGETVILKGEFSPELLSLLHPQILNLQKEFSNLHFIIEDKNVSKFRPQSSKLSWLDPSLYKVEYSPEIAKKTMEEKTAEGKIVKEDYPEIDNSIPYNSKDQADVFIKNRKDKLLGLLQENPILQIFGHSGVGKSSLLREIAKTSSTQPSDVAVYNELSSLEAWSQDTSEKTKILVIDEFNVDGSTNFTLFRDLANNPNKFPQTIFHDGKSVTLTEKHKVVFLGNPPNYGNRFKQKLFEDCQIREWHLQDFPVSYIYEEILAKPIYEGLSAESKRKLSIDEFKKIAHDEITKYKAKNQGDPQTKDILPSETVRELQEKVLKEIVKKISPIQSSQVRNNNFIATNVNQQNITELQSAIEIRKLQKSGELPSQYLGTCGVIFEGDSGVGKSVMIEAVLENRGITKIDSLETLKRQIEIEKNSNTESETSPEIKPHYYYKIPASLPIEEIEKNLIKAFELGVIVVFDEMNTRIEEGGLEKTINALLTGQHPTNPQIKPQAGFMLIASVNKATNAGRSKISTAIIDRSFVIKAESLSKYKAQDFEEIIGNWIENEGKQKEEIGKEASEAIKKIVETQPEKLKNLRDLQKIIPEILSELKAKNNELTQTSSLR